MIENEAYFNPFPGLRAFEEDEEYLFFGREKQIDDLLDLLEKTHFLAVIGTSGSGKSSLVKSGLLPSLHSGFIRGVGKGWRIGVFRPGENPIGNLAACLSGQEFISKEEEEEDFDLAPMVESVLRRSDDGIANVVDQFLAQLPENILLVADQFEELFRFSKYEKTSLKGTRDSVLFVNLLLAAIKDKKRRIYIVFTMRSDFLGNCTEFRGFPEAINKGQYLIPRMTREEVKLAITGPIAVSGAEISPQLVTMFLNGVGDNPDQLPILQHALMRTCDYWSKNTDRTTPISIKEYEAIGKMELALSKHADEAFNELSEEQKEICPLLFKTLTEVGTSLGGVRRPTKLLELCELLEVSKKILVPIIDIFRQRGRSFLMPPIEVELNDDSVIDISHESLMRVWLRLVKWFKEESDSVEIYMGLCQAANLHKEGRTGLYRDPELQLALKWKGNQKPTKLWANRYNSSFELAMSFLSESEEQYYFEIEQAKIAAKKKRKRAILLFIFLVFGLLVSISLAYWAMVQRDIADQAKESAEEERFNAKKATLVAEEAKFLAERLKNEAVISAKEAKVSAKEAKKQAEIANQQKNIALAEKSRANQEANRANQEATRANENASMAEEQRSKAENSKKDAELSKAETERLKNIADAKYDAIKAIKMLENKETAEGIQMAISAYEDFIENSNNNNDDEVYEALYLSVIESGKAKLSVENDYGLRKVRTHPLRNTIATLNENAQLSFIELNNSNRLNEINTADIKDVQSFSFSSDGNHLILVKNNIELLQYQLNSAGFPDGSTPIRLLSSDPIIEINSLKKNSFMVSTNSGLSFFKIENNVLVEIKDQELQIADLNEIAYSEKLSAVAYSNSQGSILEIKSKSNSQKISCNHVITSIEFADTKNQVAIGLSNGSVRLLSLSDQLEVKKDVLFSNHSTKVSKVHFIEKAEGIMLLSTSFDNTLNILNLEDVQNNKKDARKGVVLKGHNIWVHDIALSFDKNHFFTVSEDKTLRYWFLNPVEMVQILKENK